MAFFFVGLHFQVEKKDSFGGSNVGVSQVSSFDQKNQGHHRRALDALSPPLTLDATALPLNSTKIKLLVCATRRCIDYYWRCQIKRGRSGLSFLVLLLIADWSSLNNCKCCFRDKLYYSSIDYILASGNTPYGKRYIS